jgi:hypothetical protein
VVVQVFGKAFWLQFFLEEGPILSKLVEHDGMILDGNSRFAACLALQIEPKIKPWNGEAGSPVAFVISRNIRRRHLKPSQRAWLISQLTTFKRGDVSVQRSRNIEENDDSVATLSLTTTEAAVIAGVESTTVKNAKLVRERGSTKETVRLVGEAISAGINATMPEVLADAAAPAGSRTLHADSLGSTPEAKPPQRRPRGPEGTSASAATVVCGERMRSKCHIKPKSRNSADNSIDIRGKRLPEVKI